MLGLGIGLTDVTVIVAAEPSFPALPAGRVLLLDDTAIPSTTSPTILEEDGALLTEEF
jgi:hypothetical protein